MLELLGLYVPPCLGSMIPLDDSWLILEAQPPDKLVVPLRSSFHRICPAKFWEVELRARLSRVLTAHSINVHQYPSSSEHVSLMPQARPTGPARQNSGLDQTDLMPASSIPWHTHHGVEYDTAPLAKGQDHPDFESRKKPSDLDRYILSSTLGLVECIPKSQNWWTCHPDAGTGTECVSYQDGDTLRCHQPWLEHSPFIVFHSKPPFVGDFPRVMTPERKT